MDWFICRMIDLLWFVVGKRLLLPFFIMFLFCNLKFFSSHTFYAHLLTFHSLSLLLSWEVILDAVLHCWLARLLALWQVLQSQIYVYSEEYSPGAGGCQLFSFQITGAVCACTFQTRSSFVVVNQCVLVDLCW